MRNFSKTRNQSPAYVGPIASYLNPVLSTIKKLHRHFSRFEKKI